MSAVEELCVPEFEIRIADVADSRMTRRMASTSSKRTGAVEATGPRTTIFTVGHSTRTLAEFVHLLQGYGVQCLVDIRSIPRSRHAPQFNSDTLADNLQRNGIRYVHINELGGRRHKVKNSVNSGWRNASFQGYSDYMQTTEFERGIERLLQIARGCTAAIMCAEAVPWRCHRSLVGDALLVRGITVRDILSETSERLHELTPFARVEGETITYRAEAASDKLPFPDAERG